MADDNKGKGFLFPNAKATEENKQPHLTGELVTPKGEKVKVAAWTNKSKKGDEYLSLKADTPQDKYDDVIPF